MTLASLLSTVSSMLPIIQTLVGIIDTKKESDIPEIIDLAAELIPNVQSLIAKIELIRDQTPDEHQAVWDALRSDWDATVAKWKSS
jgi:hypothetical protein